MGCGGGPDVEMGGGQAVGVRDGIGGDAELAPERVDVGLMVVEPGVFHEVVPDGGVGAVRADEEVKADFDLRGGWGDGEEPGEFAREVGAGELVVEVECYVGECGESIEQV
jgi:hypothetical protein